MPISTTKLIAQWNETRRAETSKVAQLPSYYLHRLVIESFSRTERDVFRYLEQRGETDSGALAKHFALTPSHVLNVLGHLCQYGVVTKRQNPEVAHKEYLWSVLEETAQHEN